MFFQAVKSGCQHWSIGNLLWNLRTVELYTDWCMVEILDLKPQLLTWPTPDARKEIQKGFDKVVFEGCEGLIDGSLVVLSTCPQLDGQED
ncbi:hypothetical protein VP01_603g9 [Puccinia sorghi]|uniref:Uncharacterized protein n=1 Tax=Puccinia sorghi TaxID=27349 RepID=A0A0L6UHD5_9BASI|nr:hypothetical protein VP01_603g9 [Puccinia sorghi]